MGRTIGRVSARGAAVTLVSTVLLASCKTGTATGPASEAKDAWDVADSFLPMTVAFQWSCIASERTDAEATPLPPPKAADFPGGKAELYLAMQTDTFYLDSQGKFLNDPKNTPPETWVRDGFGMGPGYRPYKIQYTLKQQMDMRRNAGAAPVPSFKALRFSGLLTSGNYAGSFFATPVATDASAGGADTPASNGPVTYDCYQKKWWPLAPPGW